MSNHYIGDKCADITVDNPWQPITQVVVKNGESVSYTAGTTTGRTFEVECAIASQAIADDLLTKFNGFTYEAYQATDALIKPSVELGDTVSVGGVYSIVGGIHLTGDMILAADLSAPSSGDIDHEYPYDEWKKVFVDAKNIRHGGGHGTVAGDAITPESIFSSRLADACVEAAKLADEAVTAAKVAAAAITAQALAANSVTNAACDSAVSQSLADADYSADVFSGNVTASFGKFSSLIASSSFSFKNHPAKWEQVQTAYQQNLHVIVYE